MQNPDNPRGVRPPLLHIQLIAAFLHLIFELLYHQFAWTYDAVAWVVSLGSWKKWVSSVVPYLNGPRTLEIGFGPGHLQAELTRKGINPIGLDESRQMVRIARRRIFKLGAQTNLVRGDALLLPFAEQSFHQVVMTFPAEFILKQATLIEIRRVLVDEGMVIMLPMAWITGRAPLERAVAAFTRLIGESPEWHEESLEPLKNAGFTVDWEMIDLRSSRVLVIRMVKSITPGGGLQST
jgi:ubiquinone/menaquinone biosynthesis C-methylase UbiE